MRAVGSTRKQSEPMQRLELLDEPGGPSLPSLPPAPSAACELIACTATAAAYAGASAVSYPQLLCSSGAAFMLTVSPNGFRHCDAMANRWRFLPSCLAEAGFDKASVLAGPRDLMELAREELEANRPLVVAGCFPEAPWRAGLVVGLAGRMHWAVMDSAGRVHRLAPRASLVVATGQPTEPTKPPLQHVLRRCFWCWEGVEEDEGAAAWRTWLMHLGSEPPADRAEAASQAAAHECLYETLLDGRANAAAWLADLALEAEGLAAEWLMEASDALGQMVSLLESREPAPHQPEVRQCFTDSSWRAYLVGLLAEAAELDLQACRALSNALDGDYPPNEL